MSDAIGSLIVVAIWAAAVIGWLMNAWKAIGMLGDPLSTMFVFRCVGILFAPLGAILGYF